MSRKYWTPEEDALLKKLMTTKKYSYNQMAVSFVGRSGTALRKRALNQLGLNHNDYTHRLHYYNQSFFAVPNPVNCYVAGFYAADGCIGDNPTTRYLSISLSEKDGHQVETFARLLEYSGKVTIDPKEYWGPDHSNMHSLRLYGAHQITADLERVFGLTPSKTFRIPAPNLTDQNHKLCYLAGLLDGDGCVNLQFSQGVTTLYIKYVSSSREIVEWVKTFIDSLNLVSKGKRLPSIVRKASGVEAFNYNVGGSKAVDLAIKIKALKSQGLPLLDRKWDNQQLNDYIKDFSFTQYQHGEPLALPD